MSVSSAIRGTTREQEKVAKVTTDLCRLPVRLFPSKMNIIPISSSLDIIKDRCIVKEPIKVIEMRPREWNSPKSNYSLPEIDVISASRSLEIALESCITKEKRKLVELWLQKRNYQNIKLSVAKMDVIGAPLILQKANECYAINQGTPKNIRLEGEKELGACTAQHPAA